jgi:ribosomal protein S28E/S33
MNKYFETGSLTIDRSIRHPQTHRRTWFPPTRHAFKKKACTLLDASSTTASPSIGRFTRLTTGYMRGGRQGAVRRLRFKILSDKAMGKILRAFTGTLRVGDPILQHTMDARRASALFRCTPAARGAGSLRGRHHRGGGLSKTRTATQSVDPRPHRAGVD